MSEAPAWFLPVALGLFPASLAVMWLLSHLPYSKLAEAAFRSPFALPIAAGVASLLMLWYGANTYETY